MRAVPSPTMSARSSRRNDRRSVRPRRSLCASGARPDRPLSGGEVAEGAGHGAFRRLFAQAGQSRAAPEGGAAIRRDGSGVAACPVPDRLPVRPRARRRAAPSRRATRDRRADRPAGKIPVRADDLGRAGPARCHPDGAGSTDPAVATAVRRAVPSTVRPVARQRAAAVARGLFRRSGGYVGVDANRFLPRTAQRRGVGRAGRLEGRDGRRACPGDRPAAARGSTGAIGGHDRSRQPCRSRLCHRLAGRRQRRIDDRYRGARRH